MLVLVRGNLDPVLAYVRNWYARFTAPCPEEALAQVFSLTQDSVRAYLAEYETVGTVIRVRDDSGGFNVMLSEKSRAAAG